jgi:hypothetical protein
MGIVAAGDGVGDEPHAKPVLGALSSILLVSASLALLDDNEGVNVKSSFDGIRLIAKNEWARVDAFAVKPTAAG